MGAEATPLKLCVNGSLGSGKSTVATRLAEDMGLEYFATGRIQRSLAESLGITILELNQRAERDKEIDRLIDGQFEPIAAAHPRIVFDSRMAWNFVPQATKVRLLCNPATSANRIFQDRSRNVEAFDDLASARASIEQRRLSERSRFLEYYGVDIEDLGNYHLALQTDLVSPQQVVAAIERWLGDGAAAEALLLNPRMVFPLSGSRETGADAQPLQVVKAGDCFFAAAGAEALSQALSRGDAFIAARRLICAGPDSDEALGMVRPRLDEALLERWRREHGFEFSVSPEI